VPRKFGKAAAAWGERGMKDRLKFIDCGKNRDAAA